MKKTSLALMLLISSIILLSIPAMSQDKPAEAAPALADEKPAATASEGAVKPEAAPAAESLTKEDSETASLEPVYEDDDINALKGKPRVYSDEYNNYINDRVRLQLENRDNVMGDSVFYKIGEGKEEKYAEPFTVKDEGPHVIYYYSVDKMGNMEMQKSLNFIVDNTAPSVSVTVAAPFVKTNETIYASENFSYTYSIQATDNAAGVASVFYAYEGKGRTEYTTPFTVKSAAPVKLEIFSEDKVGNVTRKYAVKILNAEGTLLSENSGEVSVTVDKTAPEVTIKPDMEFFVKEGENVASKNFKYSISAIDSESGVASISCKIDEQKEFIPYTGEITFDANGKHKVEAVAKDAVGNVCKTVILNVTVDTIPAKTSIKFVTE